MIFAANSLPRQQFAFLLMCIHSLLKCSAAFQMVAQYQRNSIQLQSQSQPTNEVDEQCISRRNLFTQASALTAGTIFAPNCAEAAPPITEKDTQTLVLRAQRAMREKPPKVLRGRLSQDFAVLLMRSSYKATDEIDVVAMDQFQRDFFIIRQSEYQPYIDILGPGLVQQGDLTDPYYFDFISFAQYAAINREITQSPSAVFEEKQPVDVGEDQPQEFRTVLVKRDPSLTNDMLAPEHSRRVGAMILDRLEEIFGGTDAAIPRIARSSQPDSTTLLSALKQMVNLYLVNGFAFDGNVSIVSENPGSGNASGTRYKISMNSPATIWGGKALQKQGAVLTNNFVLKTAQELVSRAGYEVVKPSISYDNVREDIVFTIG